jgi:hypothetical protein
MMQMDLFAAAPVIRRPARPDTAMLLAMSDNAPPRFNNQATGAAAAALISEAMAITAQGFCLSRVKGHETAKRAAEIAITGKHDLAISGDIRVSFDLCARLWHLRSMADGDAAGAFMHHVSEFEDPDAAPMACGLDDFAGYEGYTETSAIIAARIAAARERMNGLLPLSVDDHARRLMMQATEAMKLEFPAQNAVHDVARTIAHLAGCGIVNRIHIAEALSYVAVRK